MRVHRVSCRSIGVAALILVCLQIACNAQQVHAADPERVQISDIEQQDLDGDGHPELTIIDCQIIAAYPQGNYPGFGVVVFCNRFIRVYNSEVEKILCFTSTIHRE